MTRRAPIRTRPATPDDLPFLTAMLVEATNWDRSRQTTADTVQQQTSSWRYLADWPRDTDFGVIALAGDTPVGAAWARALTQENAGYGYVSDDVPEITLAVDQSARGRGVGRALLAGLILTARARGISSLSLSVEDGNYIARRLYQRFGFAPVGRAGNSDTMLLRLAAADRAQLSRGIASVQPRKWLGPKGGWLVFLAMTAFWLFNVLYDELVVHQLALSPNSLILGGFGMTGALVYTIAYRLRPAEGISVLRLLLAFLLGGLLSTELAVFIESPLLSFAVASNPNGSLIIRSLAGVIEELCKIAAVVVVARGLTVKTAHSGLMLGGAVGLGFAAFEDMRYAASALLAPQLGLSPLGSVISVTFGRDVVGPFEHPVLTSLLAAALFTAARSGRFRVTWRVVGVYLCVAAAHGLIDALPGLLALTGASRVLAEALGGLLSILVIVGLGVVWLIYSRRLRSRILEEEFAGQSIAPGYAPG